MPGCDGLLGYVGEVQRWTENIDPENPSELEIALLSCEHKLSRALDECPGHGGEGGGGAGGQSGAGAGGQSGAGAGGQSGGGVGGR